jgi:hypothetical protein
LQAWAGAPNEVEARQGETGIKVIINGSEVIEIADNTEPKHRGGKNGYIVVISPADVFPSGGVDVEFIEDK